jgi:hypothetical protein
MILEIGGRNCHVIGDILNEVTVIVKPLGEFERLLIEDECRLISEMSSVPFCMVAFEVTEADLRPNGAEDTYQYLEKVLLPYIKANMHPIRLILGGYSLGGLFALWSVTRTDAFDAVYAGSPSLWMEGWNEYADTHPLKVEYAYMSLGDKEECTRKQPFCIIGNRVRLQHKRHEAQLGSDHCILEWNEGGHFNEIEKRKAKGAAWCIKSLTKPSQREGCFIV